MKEKKKFNIEAIYYDNGKIESIAIDGKHSFKEIMNLTSGLLSDIQNHLLYEAGFLDCTDKMKALKIYRGVQTFCDNRMIKDFIISLFLDNYEDYTDNELDQMGYKVVIYQKGEDDASKIVSKLNTGDFEEAMCMFSELMSMENYSYDPNVENKCIKYGVNLNYFQKMNIMLYEWSSFLKEVQLENNELAFDIAKSFSENFKEIVFTVLNLKKEEE